MAVVDVLAELAADPVTLVTGPPMTGKYDLLFRLIADASDGVVVISTKNGAARVLDDFRAVPGAAPGTAVGVVDCVSRDLGRQEVEDDDLVRYVNGPADLTSIGVKFTELSNALEADRGCEHVAVGLHSASQLVMHADTQQVYKFLQVLTGQIRTAGWRGAVVVDEPTTSQEEASMLEHHFDGLVRTREGEDGRRQYRVRGETGSTEWEAF